MSTKELEQVVDKLTEQEPGEPSPADIDYGGVDVSKLDAVGLIEAWQDAFNREGRGGYGSSPELSAFVEVLNDSYSDFESFFNDNPGAIEELWMWLHEQVDKTSEWKEAVVTSIQELGGRVPGPGE